MNNISTQSRRQNRCGYCYAAGHNRMNCPAAKTAAAAGDKYATALIKRSEIRKCSHCSGTDHNVSKCRILYDHDVSKAQLKWACIEGLVSVIRAKKLGKGAFVFGPLTYKWYSYPTAGGFTGATNYELVNFIIEGGTPNESSLLSEETKFLRVSTLAEAQQSDIPFEIAVNMPGLYDAVCSNITNDAHAGRWAKMQSMPIDSRNILKDNFQVLVEATPEAVEEMVQGYLSLRPDILNYSTLELFKKATRAAKKKLKEGAV